MDYKEAIEVLHYATLSGGHPKDLCYMKAVATLAMQELQEYKQLGTLEEVREAMEKQKRKKPRASDRCYVCPNCGLVTSLKIKHNYCDACGQHIDWTEVEEKTCCGMPLTIIYRSRFSANGNIVTLVRLQCNVCGKRTKWYKSVEEAYRDWSEKE